MASGWARLGQLITAERVRRGHRSLAAFAAASGISKTTLDSLEHARKTNYAPDTIAQLEHALGWQAGSVQRVLAGLEPRPDGDPTLTALLNAWPRLSPGSRRMLMVLAIEGAKGEEQK